MDVGHRGILKNIRAGLIDPDTPQSAMTKRAADGSEWQLVASISSPTQCVRSHRELTSAQFSDEFNEPGRTFYDGDDPYFQAVDLWYGVTQDLEVSATYSLHEVVRSY